MEMDYRNYSSKKRQESVGTILNDCILRRLFNAKNSNSLKTFNNIPLAEYSTFGELLGLINQTLTTLLLNLKSVFPLIQDMVDILNFVYENT
ncbi:MAG: hypothetical protein PHE16_11065 [Aliarcobacter sp.]|nr:hypothetical protein [Aliarcobacter sp.]